MRRYNLEAVLVDLIICTLGGLALGYSHPYIAIFITVPAALAGIAVIGILVTRMPHEFQ